MIDECALPGEGLRPQLLEPLASGMPGVAECGDGPRACEQQIAPHEVGKPEIRITGDEMVQFVEGRVQLPLLNFLENQPELFLGTVLAAVEPGLAGVARGRSENESQSREGGNQHWHE